MNHAGSMVLERFDQAAQVVRPDDFPVDRKVYQCECYPEVLFRSTMVELTTDTTYVLKGELTMKGVTREMQLDVAFNGFALLPNGVPGFTVKTALNRYDFQVGDDRDLPPERRLDVEPIVYITCNIRLDYAYD